MHRAISAVFILSTIALIGCGGSSISEETSEVPPAELQWFDGGVEEAFAAARASGKPIFLYWGAEWCPPCHNLKVNVFTKPEFIEAIQQFVPIHLDGDTERAQLWAEKYKIAGYPTVILFSPTGVELYRMPSDVTVEQYGALLQAAISDFRPVHQILSEVVAGGPEAANTLDLELIAYHSWVQDPQSELSDAEALEVFWRLYTDTPEESDRLRARFMTLTLERAMPRIGAVQALYGESTISALDDQQIAALRSGLVALFDKPDLWSDNKIFLTLQSRQAIATLEPEPSPSRDELVDSWLAVAGEMQNHPGFSDTEQLMAFVPEFELLAFLQGENEDSIPPSLQDKVRARTTTIVAEASDPGEFQSTLNMLVWLLKMAQLPDEAEALLNQHMDHTVAPHYFLSLLGDLTKDDPETALEWHRLAFARANRGSARVKWGAAYLSKLIQLAPQGAEAIETASRELIAELAASEDAFAGRNHAYVQQVDQAITAWAEETGNEAIIDTLRLEFIQQCDRFKDGMDEMQFERCLAFLDPASSSASD